MTYVGISIALNLLFCGVYEKGFIDRDANGSYYIIISGNLCFIDTYYSGSESEYNLSPSQELTNFPDSIIYFGAKNE